MPYPMMPMAMMAPHPYLPPNGMIPPNGVNLPAYPMYWPPPTAGRPVVHASMLHPHMLGGLMGGHMVPAGGAGKERKGEGKKGGVTVLDEISKRTMCPRCEGYGWKHESSGKHDKKKSEKCKLCVSCKACSGSGTVANKRACSSCETKGFTHASTDRPHDAPQHLRCFFCKDCPSCKGLGIEDAPAPSFSSSSSTPASPSRTNSSTSGHIRHAGLVGDLRRGSAAAPGSPSRSIQSWHSASSFGSGSSAGSGGLVNGAHYVHPPPQQPMSPP
ncbi:hypothetical protein HK097_010458, partial [Rhizophlyctis rosea]